MNTQIETIEGIGKKFTDKLNYIGIKTTEELLATGMMPEGRQELSDRSNIPLGHIDNWVSMIDLTRINGIGNQFAELLIYSGVSSVADLRKRNPGNLYESITIVNEEKNFTKLTPSVEMLKQFIDEAKLITDIIKV